MTHRVKVARCNCGAMDMWPDGCHHWTAVCTCGWDDLDADDQPGAMEAACDHLAVTGIAHTLSTGGPVLTFSPTYPAPRWQRWDGTEWVDVPDWSGPDGIACHVCGPEPCDQSRHPEQQDQPSRSLTGPHSDSLDDDLREKLIERMVAQMAGTQRLMQVVREALADAWDDGWHAGYRADSYDDGTNPWREDRRP